jgi:pimeloyl-ACP methyl ester carboxylesterase
VQYLDLPGGRLAYDDEGDGPLIVCLPSMLDLRSQVRFLKPRLVETGYRVVTLDQRGMGESSAAWPEYGSTPLAHDLMALLRHLDAGPALVYGCSNGAAAAVYAAAEAPELVKGLVLAAPFVRNAQAGLAVKLTMALFRIPGLALPLAPPARGVPRRDHRGRPRVRRRHVGPPRPARRSSPSRRRW